MSRMRRVRAKAENFDERLMLDYSLSYVTGFALTLVLAAVFTVPHEFLHAAGAVLGGGSIEKVVWLDLGNWVSTFIFPLNPGSAELGSVTASIGSGLIPRFMFYFLPYLVLFPVSIIWLLGDNVGLSNKWRILGGPLFIHTFVPFWTDLGLFLGEKGAVYPFPDFFPLFYRFLYLGVVLGGVVATTIYLEFYR